jgi:hypothetical protein
VRSFCDYYNEPSVPLKCSEAIEWLHNWLARVPLPLIRATCATHFIFLDLIILITIVEECHLLSSVMIINAEIIAVGNSEWMT